MHCLTLVFKILSFCGIWLPVHWQDRRYLRYLYNLFTASVVACVNVIVILQTVLLFINEFDVSFVADTLFTMLCAVSIVTKSYNILTRRDKVIDLANMLLKSWCLPRSAAEIMMDEESDEFLRIFMIYFNAVAQSAVALMLVKPLLQGPEERDLPFRIWLPYDTHDSLNYWITYSISVGIAIVGVLLNVTVDVIVSGFVLKACVQLDLLKHRLNKLPNIARSFRRKGVDNREAAMTFEQRSLRQAALHHDYIIKFAKIVSKTFDAMVEEQFFAGALFFSLIVYLLTINRVSLMKKFMAFVYLICVMTELYAYCWFENEITIQRLKFSTDYEKTMKILIIIMMRTNQPVVMSCGRFIILNIDSFKSILKITYTVFNVVKKASSE